MIFYLFLFAYLYFLKFPPSGTSLLVQWLSICLWASLVAQWLRIRLPMQGTRVRALVREDPTCRGAIKPASHNYWACALEPASHNYWARVPQLLRPTRLEPMPHNKRSHCNEKPAHRDEDAMQPKIKKTKTKTETNEIKFPPWTCMTLSYKCAGSGSAWPEVCSSLFLPWLCIQGAWPLQANVLKPHVSQVPTGFGPWRL